MSLAQLANFLAHAFFRTQLDVPLPDVFFLGLPFPSKFQDHRVSEVVLVLPHDRGRKGVFPFLVVATALRLFFSIGRCFKKPFSTFI